MSIYTWEQRIQDVYNQSRIPIIAEIKSSTPDKGDLLRGRDIARIAKDYTEAGAACISVVTGKWFGGNLSMLEKVASSTSLPILRKDLIVTTDQIRQSKECGANAILLTKKVLGIRQLNNMIETCDQLGVCPVIEVSDLQELNTVHKDAKAIIAITNRDITQKEQDNNSGLKSLDLVPIASSRYKTIISASGIHNSADANKLINAGFNALLVGTSLLCSENPKRTLSNMMMCKKEAEVLA